MIIDEINDYLKKRYWMDFEVVKTGANLAELHGFIDEAYDDEIIIRFKSVYLINIVTRFSYKGKGDFISLVNGEKEYSLNTKYDVTIGNKIFQISNTNIPSEMIIIANDIEMEVLN